MKRPTEPEIRAFLEDQAFRDPVAPTLWRVPTFGDTPYRSHPESYALLLSELCLLTNQKLSDVVTLEGQLDMARRVADLEETVKGLST